MKKRSSLLFDATNLAILLFVLQLTTLTADSLWKDDKSPVSIFADKKAHRIGDIVTIVVQENNLASRAKNTTTSKTSGVDASIQSFLYGPTASGLLTQKGNYPALKFNSKNDFSGGGQINNTETITAQIAVKVLDVLPNGNLVVEGRKQTAFSGEKQDAILRGTIRTDDIAANNTVFSYNVADATIQFISHGTISDTQNKGWFNKVWDKVTPF